MQKTKFQVSKSKAAKPHTFSISKVSPSTLLFHGTNSANLAGILSQGLITSARKTFTIPGNFHEPSLETLGGVYLTNNLNTAWSIAASNENSAETSRIIVFVNTNPKSLFLDEDELNLHKIGLKDIEYAQVYRSLLDAPASLIEQRVSWVNKVVSGWVLEASSYGFDLVPRVAPVRAYLEKVYNVEVCRRVSYLEPESFYGICRTDQPDPVYMEQVFKHYQDKLTKLLKPIAVGRILNGKDVSVRACYDIGFSGETSIQSIIALKKERVRNRTQIWWEKIYGDLDSQTIVSELKKRHLPHRLS
jgi:hypothetical protein